ncbi:hypothetical protein [Mucilaginibacter flavus]|uniref:hypothetical protein n=1 Tax=Mucilaginibacter flavus TaxID=931504 RepID=UPI0025B4816D|nr:hypothetical protein [Mucilaginibacter flavus]MDN3581381.1 hypothetical protein [Mucilaginibacter flavus]
MKHLYLITLALMFTGYSSYAQNTFPSSGNVGIGTTSPASALDVNGAIALKGVTAYESKPITTASDGTVVVASGARIRGTYTLTFEAGNRLQTVVLLANATQYDYNSSLSVLSNSYYNNTVVMSNFRFVFSADNTTVYLVFDISNRNGGTLVTAIFNGTGVYPPQWGGTLPTSANAGGLYPLVVNMGNVGINTIDTKGYKFAVNGNAIATSMTVKLYANWPDFVFKPDYELPALTDIKTYIDQNHHLPEIPSEQEVAQNGLNLGEMNRLLLKKMEEMTLYMVEAKEEINELKKQVKDLKTKVK